MVISSLKKLKTSGKLQGMFKPAVADVKFSFWTLSMVLSYRRTLCKAVPLAAIYLNTYMPL